MDKTFEELLDEVISAHKESIFATFSPASVVERRAATIAALVKKYYDAFAPPETTSNTSQYVTISGNTITLDASGIKWALR